jgi:imidazolonepropionase-like amidohydrolase
VKRSLAFVLSAFLLASCRESVSKRDAAPGEPVLAIHNGRLWDGSGGPVVADGVVVVRGNRIEAAGPASKVKIPEGARKIDAGGGFIMPGVIDNHVHLNVLLEKEPDPLTRWLRAGVTTVVDTGTAKGTVARLRERVAAASKTAPRLFVAGPIFTAPDGYPAPRREPGMVEIAEGVTTPEEAEAKVDRLLGEEKADLVKVAIETGFFSDYDAKDGWPVPSPPVLAALQRAAHRHGRTIRAHVTQPGELAAALDAGFDGTAHTPIVDVPEELLARAAKARMIFVSTANIWEDPPLTTAVQKNLARYVRLGGRVALGTDVPFQPGSEMPLGEMRLLVAGGLTPRDVLLAATRHGAEALGQGEELGTLAPGKLADLIVVPGDPLARIDDLGTVRVVVRDGEVIVP